MPLCLYVSFNFTQCHKLWAVICHNGFGILGLMFLNNLKHDFTNVFCWFISQLFCGLILHLSFFRWLNLVHSGLILLVLNQWDHVLQYCHRTYVYLSYVDWLIFFDEDANWLFKEKQHFTLDAHLSGLSFQNLDVAEAILWIRDSPFGGLNTASNTLKKTHPISKCL